MLILNMSMMKVMHLEIAFLVYLSTRNSQSSVWKSDSAAMREGWSEAKASIRKTKRTYGTRGKNGSFIKKSWCILRNIHHKNKLLERKRKVAFIYSIEEISQGHTYGCLLIYRSLILMTAGWLKKEGIKWIWKS